MYKCSVETCKNRYSISKIVGDTTQNNGVMFFEFPASPTRRKTWLEKIGRPYYKPVKSARVCAQHFHEKDLARKDNTVILDKNTIPLSSHLEKSIDSTRRLSLNSLRSSGETILQTKNKRAHPKSITSTPGVTPKRPGNSALIEKHDSGVKKASNPNSCPSTPTPKRTRNTALIETHDSGVKKASNPNSCPSTPTPKRTRNTALIETHDSGVKKASNPNSRTSTPVPKRTRNSAVIETHDSGVKRASNPNSCTTTPVPKRTRNSAVIERPDSGVKKAANPNIITSTPAPKRPHNSTVIERPDSGVKKVANPTSMSIVPVNLIRQRRNSVFIGTYDFGVRKNAVSKSKKVLKETSTGSYNQLSIKKFLINGISSAKQQDDKKDVVSSKEDCIFGWTLMGSHDIPYIVRDTEKYCALRMIENTALANNEKKNSIIDSIQANFECYVPTTVQCHLLNEINYQHCDSTFGRAPFSSKHKLVRLSDASKFFAFWEVCQKAHSKGSKASTKGLDFGFTLINKKAYIPYAVLQEEKFIPLTYLHCDGEILEFLTAKSEKISGDDALLLKLCCKYDGILELNDTMDVIALAEIQKLAPPKTTFKDCFPTGQKNHDLRVMQTTKGLRLEYIKRIT